MPHALDTRVVMPLRELLEASRRFVHPQITAELARVRTPEDMYDLVMRVMLIIVEYTHGMHKYVIFSALEDDAKNVIMRHQDATLEHRTLIVRISAGAWTPQVDAQLVVPFDPVRTLDEVVPETPQTPEEEEVGTSWQPCQRRRLMMGDDEGGAHLA